MDKKELICIGCPLGCSLEVEVIDDNNLIVRGHSCKKGEIYGIKECTNPTRIVTTTVLVEGGVEVILPVKTERDISKHLVFDCVKALNNVTVQAPISIGDIIVENILGTGINIVATKKIVRR